MSQKAPAAPMFWRSDVSPPTRGATTSPNAEKPRPRASETQRAVTDHGAAAAAPIKPEFVPLPPVGALEIYSGLKRGKLNQLILPSAENNWMPPVKSVSLRQRGCLKGKRLIHLQSLLNYLYSQAGDSAVADDE